MNNMCMVMDAEGRVLVQERRLILGPAQYVEHSGSRPINITWKLLYKMPARLCRMTERMAIA